MFPRHKVTSASLPACLLLFVQRSAEGRAHWRQRWCHHCDHYCAVSCPIFDQASLRAGQNVCLCAARRNSGLPVLIKTGPVFIAPKTVFRAPPQAHLSLLSHAPPQKHIIWTIGKSSKTPLNIFRISLYFRSDSSLIYSTYISTLAAGKTSNLCAAFGVAQSRTLASACTSVECFANRK